MPPEYHFLLIFQESLPDLLTFPVWEEDPPDLSARLGLALSPAGLHLWDLGQPADHNLESLARRFVQELEAVTAANKPFLAFHARPPENFWRVWAGVRFLIGGRYFRVSSFEPTDATPPLLNHWREFLVEFVVEDRQGTGRVLAGPPEGAAVQFFLNPQCLTLRSVGMIDELLGKKTLRRRALVLPPSIDNALPPASEEVSRGVDEPGVDSFRQEVVRRGRDRQPCPAAVRLLEMVADPLLLDFWREGGRFGFSDRPDGVGRRVRVQPAHCSSRATAYRRDFIYDDQGDFFGAEDEPPLPEWLPGLRDGVRDQTRLWRDAGQLVVEASPVEPARPTWLPRSLFLDAESAGARAAGDFLLWLGGGELPPSSAAAHDSSDRGGTAVGMAAWLFAPALFPTAVGGELWRLGLPETGAAFFRALRRLLSEEPKDVRAWLESLLATFLAESGLVDVDAAGRPANDWRLGQTDLEPPAGGARVSSLFLALPARDSWLRAVPLLHLLCPLECRLLAGCQPWPAGLELPGAALAGLDLDEGKRPRGLGRLIPRK